MSRIFPLVLIFTGGMTVFFFSIYQAVHSAWPDWIITSGFLLGVFLMTASLIVTLLRLRHSKPNHADQEQPDIVPEIA